MSVLIVGSVALDDIATPLEKRTDLLGGSASYASLAASYFAPVRLVGVVGDDFPPAFIKMFKDRNIDLTGLEVRAGATFRWSGLYEQNMNQRRTLSVALNVFEGFAPRLPQSYRQSSLVLLANISPDLQSAVLDQMSGHPFTIADTMDLWIDTRRDDLLGLLGRVDLLILNDGEARQLSGEDNLLRACRWLMARGPKRVAVKKGEHGCLLAGPEGMFITPAFPLDVVRDPTGAGDTFAGGLAGYLAKAGDTGFETLKRAVVEGTILASYTCEEFGLERLERLKEEDWSLRRQEFRRLTAW